MKINACINIGGSGSIKQTKRIAKRKPKDSLIAAASKTVDNDLGDTECQDMLFTPGFPSCVNHWSYIMHLMNIENLGACSHDKVIVCQTFGRETGFIAGSVRIFDPERKLPLLILLPEDQQDLDKVVDKIRETVGRHNRAIIVMAEGYNIADIGAVKDLSGQIMYGTSRCTSAQLLVDALLACGIQARSYIPTVLQRQTDCLTLELDREIAFRQGEDIIYQFQRGKTDFLASVHATPDQTALSDCKYVYPIPFRNIETFNRCLNKQFIKTGHFDVTDIYIKYLESFFKIASLESEYIGITQEKQRQKLVNLLRTGAP